MSNVPPSDDGGTPPEPLLNPETQAPGDPNLENPSIKEEAKPWEGIPPLDKERVHRPPDPEAGTKDVGDFKSGPQIRQEGSGNTQFNGSTTINNHNRAEEDAAEEINLVTAEPTHFMGFHSTPLGLETLTHSLLTERSLVLVGPNHKILDSFLRHIYDQLGKGVKIWRLPEEDLQVRKPTAKATQVVTHRSLRAKPGKHLVFLRVSNEEAVKAAKVHLQAERESNRDWLRALNAYFVFLVADVGPYLQLTGHFKGFPGGEEAIKRLLPWNLLWKDEPQRGSLEILMQQYQEGLWGETPMEAYAKLLRLADEGAHVLEKEILEKKCPDAGLRSEVKSLIDAIHDSLDDEERIVERTVLFLMVEAESLPVSAFRFLVEALLEGIAPEPPPPPQIQSPHQAPDQPKDQPPPPPPPPPKKSPVEEFRTGIDRIRRKFGLTVEGGHIKFLKMVLNANIFEPLRDDHWFFFEEQYRFLAQRQVFFDPEAPAEVIDFVIATMIRGRFGNTESGVVSLITKMAARIEWLMGLHSELLNLESKGKQQEAILWSDIHLKTMDAITPEDIVGNRLRAYILRSMRSMMISKSQLVREVIRILCKRAYEVLTRCGSEKSTVGLLNQLRIDHRDFVQEIFVLATYDPNTRIDQDSDWRELLRRLIASEPIQPKTNGKSYFLLRELVHVTTERRLSLIGIVSEWSEVGAVKSQYLYDYACHTFSLLRMVESGGKEYYQIQDYKLFEPMLESATWKDELEAVVKAMLLQEGHKNLFEHSRCKYDHIEHPADLLEKWSLILQQKPEFHEWYLECLRKHIVRTRESEKLFSRRQLLDWWANVSREWYLKRYELSPSPQNRQLIQIRRNTCSILIQNLNHPQPNSPAS